MLRRDFQVLSAVRVREAKTLASAQLYDGAYYLCGYAIEIGLKKRISQTA